MASPFGLAYGIGAGLSGIPGAYIQGQEKAQGMALRNLQIEQMKRQAQEEEVTRQAMMQDVAPKMVHEMGTVETPIMERVATGAMPEGGGVTVLPSEERQVGTEKKQAPTGRMTEYKFTTPWEQKAYEAQQRSEKLRSMGAWRTAMKLEEEAGQMQKMHQATALQMAARAAALGQYGDATKMLGALGMNISKMETSPEDPTAIRVYSEASGEPEFADIPRSHLGAIIEDPARGTAALEGVKWRNANYELQQRKLAQQAAEAEKNRQSREKIAELRVSAMEKRLGQKTFAKEATWNFAEGIVRRLHPDWSDQQVLEETAKHPLVSAVAGRESGSEKDRAARAVMAIRKELGGEPKEGDPEYQEYQRLYDLAFRSGKPKPTGGSGGGAVSLDDYLKRQGF